MLLQALVALFAQNFALQATVAANVPSMSQIAEHFLKTDSDAHNLTRLNRPPGSFEHASAAASTCAHTAHVTLWCRLPPCFLQEAARSGPEQGELNRRTENTKKAIAA